MPQERTINIDEKEDLIMAQILIEKRDTEDTISYCSRLDGGCGNEW